MRLVRIVAHRIHSFLRRSHAEADLKNELDLHIEQLTKEYITAGMSVCEARLVARRDFGAVELTKEQCRDMRKVNLLEDLARDLGYAWRMLARSPGFTLTAVLSLALGIGANTAIFSLLNALVFRLLPVRDPRQLVQCIYTFPENGPNNWNSWFDYPQLVRFREQSKTLSGIFGGTGLWERERSVPGDVRHGAGRRLHRQFLLCTWSHAAIWPLLLGKRRPA